MGGDHWRGDAKVHAVLDRATAPAVLSALQSLANELQPKREPVLKLLRRLDTNHDGQLSTSEVQRGLLGLGVKLDRTELESVMRCSACCVPCLHAARCLLVV